LTDIFTRLISNAFEICIILKILRKPNPINALLCTSQFHNPRPAGQTPGFRFEAARSNSELKLSLTVSLFFFGLISVQFLISQRMKNEMKTNWNKFRTCAPISALYQSISNTKVTGAPNKNFVLNTLKTLFSGAPRARGAPLLRKFGNLSIREILVNI